MAPRVTIYVKPGCQDFHQYRDFVTGKLSKVGDPVWSPAANALVDACPSGDCVENDEPNLIYEPSHCLKTGPQSR